MYIGIVIILVCALVQRHQSRKRAINTRLEELQAGEKRILTHEMYLFLG